MMLVKALFRERKQIVFRVWHIKQVLTASPILTGYLKVLLDNRQEHI